MTDPKHDGGYKALFSDPRMVEDLLRGFVPGSWVGRLDFSTLEKVNAHFVSDELLRREDDLIWRVRLGSRGWVYIYLMLEFQSAPDPWMALRIVVYMGLFWQDLVRQKVVKAGEKLPPVLPVVLYNGERPWNAPVELKDLVTPVKGLRAYVPKCRYLLLEEQGLPLEEPESACNLVAALFRLEQSRRPEDIVAVVELLDEWLSEQPGLRRVFTAWLRHALLPARLGGAPVPAVADLSEVRDMLQQRVIEWTKQWKQEGLDEGEAKGKRDVLFMLLESRGETLTEGQRMQLDSCSDSGLLSEWIRRIVAGDRLEDILG